MSFEEYRKEIIKNIKHCLLRTQLQPVLFIGLGISQRYINAPPNRRQLLKIPAEKCPLIKYPYGYYSQIKNDDNYLIASEFCNFYAEWAWGERSKYYPERYFETDSAKDLFIKHDVSLNYNNLTNSVYFLTFRYAKEVEHLQKLKPHAIITTNYDDFLALVFTGYKNIVGYDITNKNHISYGEIIKLHGCCHNVESLILTSEDYVHYEKNKKIYKCKTSKLCHPAPFIYIRLWSK
ncbi:SIR2 family protein [Klebsiella aerogenes]